jgi:hypothetical protein
VPYLLVEAAQVTVRIDQEWRSKYFHLAMRRGRKAGFRFRVHSKIMKEDKVSGAGFE